LKGQILRSLSDSASYESVSFPLNILEIILPLLFSVQSVLELVLV